MANLSRTWTPDPLAHSTGVLDSFLAGRSINSEADAIEILCALQSEVSHAGLTSFPDYPADCFCGRLSNAAPSWRFENAGESIRFIVETVRRRLEQEGVNPCL